ncbi:MAG: hypothetical protein M3069_32345 [Chloroflexota bacterium]|nr:hypothetical protein [Chloroflexota bacterium]
MKIDSSQRLIQVRRAATQAAEAATLAMLWLMLSVLALMQWNIGDYPRWRQRQRAQSTIEIVVSMAVLAVLALAVWKVIGPAVMAKVNGIATGINTPGTGATGTG